MGAVSFVIGSSGCDYVAPSGKTYKLSGWTLKAIAGQELYLEQRCYQSLNRLNIAKEDKAAAVALLAKDIGANMSCSYGSETWDKSLATFAGIANFFSLLAGCTIDEAFEAMEADSNGIQEAVFKANPRYRATAETPKTETGTIAA